MVVTGQGSPSAVFGFLWTACRQTDYELGRARGILTRRPSEQVGAACHILLHVACTVRKVKSVNHKSK
jgi:hypothetical protein